MELSFNEYESRFAPFMSPIFIFWTLGLRFPRNR